MQIISLLVPMFVIAYKRAYDLADAMEARGFIPDAPRTNINLLRYRTSDYLTFGFSFAVSRYYLFEDILCVINVLLVMMALISMGFKPNKIYVLFKKRLKMFYSRL